MVWADGPSNGGISIDDYRVSRRVSGEANFAIVQDGILTTSYTVDGLTLGLTYEFIVEARNSAGYSSASATFSELHALAPDIPVAPTTTNSGTEILVDWSAPSDNGSPITSYSILF